MHSDALYLVDIVEAADAIAEFVAGVTQGDFVRSKLVRSAVLQQLTVIGEAAARLSEEFRSRHPEVEWSDIAAFRNIAVHAYFSVDWSTVWATATEDATALRLEVSRILAAEFPDLPARGDGTRL